MILVDNISVTDVRKRKINNINVNENETARKELNVLSTDKNIIDIGKIDNHKRLIVAK